MSTPPPTSAPPDQDPVDDGGATGAEPRLYEPMSIRGPALVVLGIAVFIVVVGVVASALASGSDTTLSHPQDHHPRRHLRPAHAGGDGHAVHRERR